jgi:hypothetical protein
MAKMKEVDVCFYPLKKVNKQTVFGASDRHVDSNVIWLHNSFKKRVEFAKLNEDSYEYKVIVTILAIAILHECVHMFLRWLNIETSPAKFRGEVGTYFENVIFGSPITVLGKKKKEKSPWTKHVEITGMNICLYYI